MEDKGFSQEEISCMGPPGDLFCPEKDYVHSALDLFLYRYTWPLEKVRTMTPLTMSKRKT